MHCFIKLLRKLKLCVLLLFFNFWHAADKKIFPNLYSAKRRHIGFFKSKLITNFEWLIIIRGFITNFDYNPFYSAFSSTFTWIKMWKKYFWSLLLIWKSPGKAFCFLRQMLLQHKNLANKIKFLFFFSSILWHRATHLGKLG